MSSTLLARSVVRSAFRKPSGVRLNSSSSAEKKAQDALANAQNAANKALETIQKFLGPVGHRLGNLLGGYKEPIVYNFSVVREIAKKVYVNEALAPPSLSQFSAAYKQIWSNATQTAYWRGLVQNGQVTQFGIYGLQAYGLYKIGEILGRRQLVGYPSAGASH